MAEPARDITALAEIAGGKNRRAKFVQLAERRTAKALKAIRVIGNLSNKAQYDYDERDVKKIIAALSSEIDALRNRLSDADRRKGIEFKL